MTAPADRPPSLDAGADADADTDARTLANHRQLDELTSAAEALAASGRAEEAAVALGRAAAFAWMNHPGIHASPRLERLARRLAPTGPAWRPRAGRPSATERPRVLHVLTQAYPTGGHTRWSDRIIRADLARTHSVVLVGQGTAPIPAWLRRSVAESGGSFEVLAPGPILQRAIRLRRLAADADLVFANIHPHDAASVLALADPRLRPPVAALNHADHTFSLGAAAWDLLVDFRSSGQALSLRRRGTDPRRSLVLPLPVDPPEALPGRELARRALGIGPDEVVLLSAGSAWKFDPQELRGEPTFPDVLVPIVAADPRLRLFVLGPLNHGRWADAARRTDGRLLALGTRTDYCVYQFASDVYLDPFPMGSLYSLLEPGSRGLPVISYAQWPDEAAVLMCDSPGIDAGRIVAHDAADYAALLKRLVDDPEERRRRGRALADAILRAHSGPGGLERLDALAAAAPIAREARLSDVTAAPDATALSDTLDRPRLDALSRGLTTISERVAPAPERAITHLPLAG
jgi:hypothetical protein